MSGVALVTAPDSLFQPLNPLLGPAPAQPPANIAILPLDTFARTLAPALRAITPATVGARAVPGAQDGMQWQVQAQVDPAALERQPGARAEARRRRSATASSARCPARCSSSTTSPTASTTAAGDALYAETLYIMLAVPGALVALGLAYLAALGTVERDRRDLALLRARGASRRDLLVLAALESLALGVVAGLARRGARARAPSRARPGRRRSHRWPGARHRRRLRRARHRRRAARRGSARAAPRSAAASARRRRSGRRERTPLWQRLYLDVAALARQRPRSTG